jgi:hypothetical protein
LRVELRPIATSGKRLAGFRQSFFRAHEKNKLPPVQPGDRALVAAINSRDLSFD